MTPIAIGGLLLAPGCSEAAPVAMQAPPPAAPAAQLPTPFAGTWRVVAIDGRAAPPRESPILISVGAAALGARADCAYLMDAPYAVANGAMTVRPRPPGMVTSCARGLSPFENTFREVVQAGAVGRLRGERLVLERDGRTVEAVREPESTTAAP